MRGNYSVPEQLQTLSLTSHDQYSTLTRLVKNQLKLNDIQLVMPAENIPNLKIRSESVSTTTISIYQNTRAAEKAITLKVSYQITTPDVGVQTLSTSVTRSYLDNSLTALAKSVEKTMIIDEMREISASQIIRQLARLESDDTESNEVIGTDSHTVSTTLISE
ncbi:LPS assembly lipoprotein LptE [Vibrio sp. RC27]